MSSEEIREAKKQQITEIQAVQGNGAPAHSLVLRILAPATLALASSQRVSWLTTGALLSCFVALVLLSIGVVLGDMDALRWGVLLGLVNATLSPFYFLARAASGRAAQADGLHQKSSLAAGRGLARISIILNVLGGLFAIVSMSRVLIVMRDEITLENLFGWAICLLIVYLPPYVMAVGVALNLRSSWGASCFVLVATVIIVLLGGYIVGQMGEYACQSAASKQVNPRGKDCVGVGFILLLFSVIVEGINLAIVAVVGVIGGFVVSSSQS